jgi:hypothetical protein
VVQFDVRQGFSLSFSCDKLKFVGHSGATDQLLNKGTKDA